MPPALRQEFLELNRAGGNELHRAALAANALVRLYAEVVDALLKQAGTSPQAVRAIGAHGQTVRHQPQAFDGTGYTLQLNNPALLAERCAPTVLRSAVRLARFDAAATLIWEPVGMDQVLRTRA